MKLKLTTAHIDSAAIKELSEKDIMMKKLIELIGEPKVEMIDDHFISLVWAIVFQSISFKAATSIWNRLLQKLDTFKPKEVLSLGFNEIRSVGLSNSKTQYILNVAMAFENQEINVDFDNMTNKDIGKELQSIKGIGPWTTEMFLIFCLYRKDIFPFGDIAIRRGLELMYDIDHNITKDEFNYYRDLFSPHQTIAAFYIWELTIRDLIKNKNLFKQKSLQV